MNKRAIGTFIVILLILVGAVYFLIFRHGSNVPPPRIIIKNTSVTTNTITNTITNSSTSTNTIIKTNSSTNSSITNSTNLNCISPNATVPIANGNFATGTYERWNTTGLGFLNLTGFPVPTNITFANANNDYYGQPWNNYTGTFFATTYRGGIVLNPGNLTSDPFQVREPYLNFKIISPRNALLYVQLMHDNKPFLVYHYNTLNASGGLNPQSRFVSETIPLLNFVCQNVSVRVVAGVTGTVSNHYDFIAVGDFVQSKTNMQTPGTVVNRTVVSS